MTREEMAYRRSEIARDVEEGHSPRAVAEHWGITPQRVSQIIKAERLRAELREISERAAKAAGVRE